jgi:NADPH:quinone reductase-like Zn-dependent oxidoreductase
VVGGGGAVGFSAIQISVAAGCIVTTTCGSQSIDRLMAAGAEQAVDYTAEVIISLFSAYTSCLKNSDILCR